LLINDFVSAFKDIMELGKARQSQCLLVCFLLLLEMLWYLERILYQILWVLCLVLSTLLYAL